MADLIGIHTRIPQELKDELDWILFYRRLKMTDVVTEAIRAWIDKERAAHSIPERPKAEPGKGN